MTRLASCSLLFVLAACPKAQPTGPQVPAGAGCPAGDGVYIASFVTQDAGQGRTGWVLPLRARQAEPGVEVPAYAPLDAAAAAASGVPPAPTGTVWLATAAGPPCRATVGSYYAAKIPGPPENVSYGVELDGCPAPANPEDAGGIALVSEAAPTGCRFEVPRPVAARLGEMGANKQWQRPTRETPIPDVLAAAIPTKECTPPVCETLWVFGAVEAGGRTVVYSGAVNWLTVGDPANQCAWSSERFSGFFVPSPSGVVKVTEGQGEHSFVLSAVLADAGGAKVLLAEGPGAYATYDLSPGGATLARSVTWMLAPDEAWEEIDQLGPFCEPTAVAPAPLPADAKPVSPYP